MWRRVVCWEDDTLHTRNLIDPSYLQRFLRSGVIIWLVKFGARPVLSNARECWIDVTSCADRFKFRPPLDTTCHSRQHGRPKGGQAGTCPSSQWIFRINRKEKRRKYTKHSYKIFRIYFLNYLFFRPEYFRAISKSSLNRNLISKFSAPPPLWKILQARKHTTFNNSKLS
jgi:hypothetical protein